VFIVGGIGITPIISMLRAMRDREDDRQVLLLYGNRTQADIAFRDELAEIEAGGHPRLTVVHVLSQAGEDWTGHTGYVDREILQRYVGDEVAGKTFYLCGPGPMRAMTLANLKAMGVPNGGIRTEIFALVG
jgi:ferredoxin-NADP reductase